MGWHPDMPTEYRDQIVAGDARVLAEAIPDASVDLVLTDPPFGIGFAYSNGYADERDTYLDLVRWLARESHRVVKPGGMCFVYQAHQRLRETWPLFPDDSRLFAACRNFSQFLPTPVQYSYDPVVFWQKPGLSLVPAMAGRRDWHLGNTAYYITLPSFHSCPRPLDTITYLVENFCPTGGIVLDFFMGSGTTAVAAKLTGRRYAGFEIDPATAERARQRVVETMEPLPGLLCEQLELQVTT